MKGLLGTLIQATSSVHGILWARVLEGVVFPSPGDLPHPGIEHWSPALKADSLPSERWQILYQHQGSPQY